MEEEEEVEETEEQRKERLKKRKKSSTHYGWLERGEEEDDHEGTPPPETPDQGHQEGEAHPRAEAPGDEEATGSRTSPMHTRAGTILNKPPRDKKKKGPK